MYDSTARMHDMHISPISSPDCLEENEIHVAEVYNPSFLMIEVIFHTDGTVTTREFPPRTVNALDHLKGAA